MRRSRIYFGKAGTVLPAALAAVMALFVFAGCGEETITVETRPETDRTAKTDKTVKDEDKFEAKLSGQEETQPVTTQAEGEAEFELTGDGTALEFKLSVSGLMDPQAAHIHMAPAGSDGPVIVTLLATPVAGEVDGLLAEGIITVDDLEGQMAGMSLNDLLAEFKAGNTYVNVHTAAYPEGEIRGQIMEKD